MAITCNFYSFSKKENSTARPSGSGTSFSCTLKEPTSIEAPTLELAIASPTFYDYAYIPSFDRYYYVTDWTYNRGVWEVTLAVDVLASFKTEIGSSYIYVLRAANAYDAEIKDTMYPMKSASTKQVASGTLYEWASGFVGGTYIAYINNGVIQSRDLSSGSLNFMAFSPTEFAHLLEALYPQSNDDWFTLIGTNAYNIVAGALLNPIDYITKVVWIPLSPANVSEVNHPLSTNFGYYTAKYKTVENGQTVIKFVNHYAITNFRKLMTVSIEIPHRNDTLRGAWADMEPFGKYYAYYAPFGVIPLDSAMMSKATHMEASVNLDITSGDLKLTLRTIGTYGSNKDILFEGVSNVGVEIPVDKAKPEGVKALAAGIGAANVAIDYLTGNYAGMISDTMSTIGTVGAAPPRGSTTTPKGLLGLSDMIYLYHEYNDFVDGDNTNKGRPLCAVRQVSGLGGFMVTNNGNISISGTAGEKAAVRRYLEGGFYYE